MWFLSVKKITTNQLHSIDQSFRESKLNIFFVFSQWKKKKKNVKPIMNESITMGRFVPVIILMIYWSKPNGQNILFKTFNSSSRIRGTCSPKVTNAEHCELHTVFELRKLKDENDAVLLKNFSSTYDVLHTKLPLMEILITCIFLISDASSDSNETSGQRKQKRWVYFIQNIVYIFMWKGLGTRCFAMKKDNAVC